MPDYAEMRKTLRAISDRARSLDGVTCPKSHCFGTLRRHDGHLRCTDCARSPVV